LISVIKDIVDLWNFGDSFELEDENLIDPIVKVKEKKGI
jgi:hypothetical protein